MLTNKMLMRIFGPKIEDVIGELRKLNNEKLRNRNFSLSIITIIKSRKNMLIGHVMRWEMHTKCHWKRPLGMRKCRLQDNIKMDTRDIGCEIVHWIQPAQEKAQRWTFVNPVMNRSLREGNFFSWVSMCIVLQWSVCRICARICTSLAATSLPELFLSHWYTRSCAQRCRSTCRRRWEWWAGTMTKPSKCSLF
jgi:hypothetical protein